MDPVIPETKVLAIASHVRNEYPFRTQVADSRFQGCVRVSRGPLEATTDP